MAQIKASMRSFAGQFLGALSGNNHRDIMRFCCLCLAIDLFAAMLVRINPNLIIEISVFTSTICFLIREIMFVNVGGWLELVREFTSVLLSAVMITSLVHYMFATKRALEILSLRSMILLSLVSCALALYASAVFSTIGRLLFMKRNEEKQETSQDLVPGLDVAYHSLLLVISRIAYCIWILPLLSVLKISPVEVFFMLNLVIIVVAAVNIGSTENRTSGAIPIRGAVKIRIMRSLIAHFWDTLARFQSIRPNVNIPKRKVDFQKVIRPHPSSSSSLASTVTSEEITLAEDDVTNLEVDFQNVIRPPPSPHSSLAPPTAMSLETFNERVEKFIENYQKRIRPPPSLPSSLAPPTATSEEITLAEDDVTSLEVDFQTVIRPPPSPPSSLAPPTAMSEEITLAEDVVTSLEGDVQNVIMPPLSPPPSLAPTATSEEITLAEDVVTNLEVPVDMILEREGYMRECILYCSIFPADYVFTSDTLIWSWLAAGLINSEQNGKREAVAIRCFDNLVRSNYIFHSGYDHLADQMRYKVGNEKNIFFNKEYLNIRYRKSLDIGTDVAEVEHLSLIFEGIGQIHFEILTKCSRLKTLLLHQCYSSKLEKLLNDLFLNLKFLTTLDLSCTNIVELPSSIENLKALQYLDMSKTPIRRLPESVDSLGSLETLILIGCLSLCGLPKCMYKLINMQHLVLDISSLLLSMPIGIGKLTNLQTLGTFLVGTKDGTRIGELRTMNKLKGSLCITKLENISNKEEAGKALLCDKKDLTILEFIWSGLQDAKITIEEEILESLQPHFGIHELTIVSYSGGLLPSWMSDPSFTQISSITLHACRYCEKMPSLGELPSLKFLNIVKMEGVVDIDKLFCRKEDNGEKHAFPRLEKLSFDGMFNLEKWTGVADGDFPCLKELMIKYCPKLVDLRSLSYLISLQHLEIIDCPELHCLPEEGLPTSLKCLMVKDCPKLKERICKEQGEDWIDVVSVPTLYIDHQQIGSN